MSDRVISSTGSYTGYDAAVSIDAANDYMLLQQSGVYKKLNRNVLLGVTGTPADISTVQTLTNKVIGTTNTITQLDSSFTLQDNADPTKQAQFQLSGITASTTRTYTLPNASSTLVDLSTSQTLTNKTLTAPIITAGSIANSTITVDAIAEYTAANGVTVDGLNIKDGKLNTNNSVVTANITDGAVTPAKLQSGTGASWAWQAWVPTWTNLIVTGSTVTARYAQIGKTIFAYVAVVLGGGNAPTASVSFTLPVTSVNYTIGGTAQARIGIANIEDTGTTNYQGNVAWSSTTTAQILVMGSGGTYVSTVGLTGAIPHAWANGDSLAAMLSYEAA